jgi:hypothetical protein
MLIIYLIIAFPYCKLTDPACWKSTSNWKELLILQVNVNFQGL